MFNLWLYELAAIYLAVIQVSGAHRLSPTVPRHRKCPPFPGGDFTINQYQLYPENAIWNPDDCVVYFSALFNGSISVFTPFPSPSPGNSGPLPSITFANLTLTPGRHVSGLYYSRPTNQLSVVVNSPNPFLTGGADVSGDNLVVRYAPRAARELWRANLTAATRGAFGGFLDVAVDDRPGEGHAYVVGSYPASILRVDPRGRRVEVWYPPSGPTTVRGFSGVAIAGDALLVAGMRAVYRFDLRARGRRVPVLLGRVEGETNRVVLPEAYGGKVMLVSQQAIGATVFRSRDGRWRTAENLGTVRSDFPRELERIVPSSVQIGPKRQYLVGQYFPGETVPGTMAGNRSEFPMFDITAEIETLLRG
ncbi:hypothetical protein MFIFM68171_10130 [Madurella fahalii]|uniref:Uncharacterized protein n=1 Tax=Madurella fahalii TaxID=1157608 RepID=A0ABQ0GQ93_9PEZI